MPCSVPSRAPPSPCAAATPPRRCCPATAAQAARAARNPLQQGEAGPPGCAAALTPIGAGMGRGNASRSAAGGRPAACSHADGEREEAGDILSVIVTELPGQFRGNFVLLRATVS
uniref:Uncharacterized protein n=1 Tax=Setaria italica TaxID=4555 RepID=K3ZKC8_SETIT